LKRTNREKQYRGANQVGECSTKKGARAVHEAVHEAVEDEIPMEIGGIRAE